MGKEASSAVGKYMETFVREAMARAAHMRLEMQAQRGGGGGDGFLEVCSIFPCYFAICFFRREWCLMRGAEG